MVTFVCFDNDRKMIPSIDASDVLPDYVATMTLIGPYHNHMGKILTTMLKSSPKRLEGITIQNFEEDDSPEFLAFLVLVFNKTTSLVVSECSLSVGATSCLMAALLTRDGILGLSFTMVDDSPMPLIPLKILLEGVASSPCLENFHLRVRELEGDDVGRFLIQALRRNKSLKSISLNTIGVSMDDSTFLPDIARASMSGPRIKELALRDARLMPLDVLQEVLYRKDCTLEMLHLGGVRFDEADQEWFGSCIQNVSVKNLLINFTLSEGDELEKIINLFKSLKLLHLRENGITQLSFLDSLLFGEHSQLQSLDLSLNSIDEDEMESFITKLRNIRGLRHLAIQSDGWEDSVHCTALIDAVRQNTDLEHVDFDRRDLPLDLNRGGRRVFESSEPFPRNLFPLVLERASKISYYNRDDQWLYPTNNEAGADVVFWMMHRIVSQSII